MLRQEIRTGIGQVGEALRDPETFALRWNSGEAVYPLSVWGCLLATAILGTCAYGMTMGLLGGAGAILYKGFACTLATGLAWGLSLPTLYILNSLSGSKLAASSTLLAALVTVSWGGLAMLASIPINWFFTTAIPHPGFVLLVNIAVFAGVGVSMVDVFRRVMERLEPERGTAPVWWLLLVGLVGVELFTLLELFRF